MQFKDLEHQRKKLRIVRRRVNSAAERQVIEMYGALKTSEELDRVLDEKLADYPEDRAKIRAYVQNLIPHLRDM